ncbi:MAG: DMT family transporter [Acetobacteraceae bacterium]|nr:DMT family transporter [Acetobacteraceae bacterium]
MSQAAAAPAEVPRLLAGIFITLLGVFVFSLSNALAKWLTGGYPVGEILFARSVVVLLVLAGFITRDDLRAMRQGGRFGLHAWRGLLSAVEVVCFYWAIVELPLAGGTTIYLAAPIYVTALAAIFLREDVGWRRWCAVLAGFGGVLVALQPGGLALNIYTLVSLAGSFMYAASLVITRRLRGTPTTLLVTAQVVPLLLITAASAWPIQQPTSLVGGWLLPGWRDAAILGLVGLLSMVGYLCINRGIQMAPASAVTPFNYTSIVWASILGYLVFGEVPTAALLAGATIIVAAGLYIVLREHVRGVARPPPLV